MLSSSTSSRFLLDTLIKRCSATTSLPAACRLHSLLVTTALDYCHRPFVSNYIISMYVRCGSLLRSFTLFDQMPLRTTVSFNLLISALSRPDAPRHTSAVFRLFRRMKSDGLPANAHTFTAIFHSSPSLLHPSLSAACHCQLFPTGYSSDARLQTSLLTMYSDSGDLSSADTVFRFLEVKSAISWNSLISGNMKNCRADEGLRLYRRMARTAVPPTEFTYSMALSCCGRLKYLDSGRAIHALVITSDEAAVDLPLQNSLLDMYLRCRDIQTAYLVFSRMHGRDIVTWNSMIAGCSQKGDVEGAVRLLNELRAFSSEKPDQYTFASAICASRAAASGSVHGRALHALVQKAGLDSYLHIGSSLVSMYFGKGDAWSAHKVFGRVTEKDDVLMTEMVSGYSSISDWGKAARHFHELARGCARIDGFALSAALGACADSASLRSGEMIHCRALKTGMDVEMVVRGGLIDMYAKGGCIQAAETVFSAGSPPDIKCWNSIMGGYSRHGMAEEALQLLEEMKGKGEVGDEVTMLSALEGCTHCGLVDEGRRVWEYMKEKKVKVGYKHYCCMVALLSGAGMVEEAHEMLMESPFVENRGEMRRSLLRPLAEGG